MKLFFDDTDFDGQRQRSVCKADSGMANVGECLAIDGPGQGSVLYDQRIPMRPDWENVIPGIVDALIARPEVDPDRIVLVGRSFGGAVAPHGASGEPGWPR